MTGSARAYESATRRRDAQLWLLTTELAIRAFREAESQLPDSLNDLCPQYLSSVPIDPFSGAVLKYRRLDNTYVLYSVGTDGQDNGGKFGTGTDFYAKGYDFDVDTFARTDP